MFLDVSMKYVDKEKESAKVTCYLSHASLDALERAWYELRALAGAGDRARISKSLIVETALQIAFEELNAKGVRSRLAARVANRAEAKGSVAAREKFRTA